MFSFAVILYELFHRSMVAYTITRHGQGPEGPEVYAEKVAGGFR